MKLDLPLVEYGNDEVDEDGKRIGYRAGYLLQVLGDKGLAVIQPIGPVGTIPEKVRVPLAEVRMVDMAGRVIPEPVAVPAGVGVAEIELKLKKQRSITMATKAAKTAKKTGKAVKPEVIKYLTLTDKAPETKDLKEGSHAYAIIAGLRRLSGKATRERLLETIATNKLLKTDMDPSKAVSWMVGQLKGKGILKEVKEAVA